VRFEWWWIECGNGSIGRVGGVGKMVAIFFFFFLENMIMRERNGDSWVTSGSG
jgi:hypothetical protein